MTMISYSSNFEDVILARLFREQASGFYVDVGAHDPSGASNTRHFHERGWRGINIEPSSTFALFPLHRPGDVNLRVAVSDVCGQATFDECPALWAVSRLADGGRGGFKDLPGRAVTVETRTLASIFAKHAPPCIDFLSMDVEGHERRALAGNDWGRFRPRVLVIEATLPWSNTPCHEAWEDVVLGAGYQFGYFDGINRFYIREDEKALLERLQAPVNVLDDFVLKQTADLEEHARELSESLASLRAEHERVLLTGRTPLLEGIGDRSLRVGLWLARRLTRARALLRRLGASRAA